MDQRSKEKWTRPLLIVSSIREITANNGGSAQDGTHINHTSSDSRLKTSVVRAGQLKNGLSLYRFQYREKAETEYLGVMAQEVLDVIPGAVILGADDHYLVDYSMVGIPMIDAARARLELQQARASALG